MNHSHRTQLLATAMASSLATAGLLHAYNVHTNRIRKHNCQLMLTISKFNQEALSIVGCGGVSSWAAIMLGRSSPVMLRGVSRYKVTCNKKTLERIAEWVSLFIQDAIDNIRAKSRCTQISYISNTTYDPLARSVLRLLGVNSGIFQRASAFDYFRVRISPACGPLASIFGLNITTYILCELAGKPCLGKKLYKCLHQDLLHRESKIADEDDIALIFEDIYRGRSLLPPHDVPTRLTLVRWDPGRPLYLKNCVAFDRPDL
ncbi:hypothetical protein BYT27DRAFT_7219901 [Phlegmacium glaucopus]|nr:hypothetical protein BYT27DRAFT_7219901 [Phlegmacium glaucopus]